MAKREVWKIAAAVSVATTAMENIHNAAVTLQKVVSTATSLVPSPASSSVVDAMASSMPSIRSLSKLAFGLMGAGQSVLGTTIGNLQSCANPQLSCQNTTVVENLCCFNAPGGQLLLTQFWDTNPVTGPVDSWTVHGLWVCPFPFLSLLFSRTRTMS